MAGILSLFMAGTASADTVLPGDTLLSNAANVSCEMTANEDMDSPSRWERLKAWLNPFGGLAQPTGDLYLVTLCAFSPAMQAELAIAPAYVTSIDYKFGYWTSSSQTGAYPNVASFGCVADPPGVDWFPVLNGSEVRMGCTVANPNFSTFYGGPSGHKARTQDFRCLLGVEIHTNIGTIRSYEAGSGWGNTGGVLVGTTSYFPQPGTPCNTTGFNLDGVIPPNWTGGDLPPGADVTGCNGLTVKADNSLVGEVYEPGDTVELMIGAVDPERAPAAVDVRISVAEGRPRGEPIRWEGTARYPADPYFDFVVGPDSEPGQWMFLLTCSDGTENPVWFDPTGAGGNPRDGEVGGFSLAGCIDTAGELGLDPDTWVPGLVGRLKCLAEWAVTPTKPLKWHTARLEATTSGTGFGDAAKIATAPSRILGGLSSGASDATSIETGMGTVNLPAVPESGASKIRLGLSVLIGLAAAKVSIGWWSRASNTRVADDPR